MEYRRVFFCFIVSALLCIPLPGDADITPVNYSPTPYGGGVSPKSPHPAIRLDDQEVTIRLKHDEYSVDAVFHLFNTADTSTEWIAFPKNTERHPHGLGKVQDFMRFDVWVNGDKVLFADERNLTRSAQNYVQALMRPSSKHIGWLVGKASFPGHAATTIRVSYASHYVQCGMGCHEAVYMYGTGGYWKDRIKKATFVVDWTQKAVGEWEPARFPVSGSGPNMIHRRLLSEHVALYEMRDFKPSPDSALTFMFTMPNGSHRGRIK